MKDLVAGLRIKLTALGRSLYRCGDGPIATGNLTCIPDHTSQPELIGALAGWGAAVVLAESLADHLGRDVEALWDEIEALRRTGEVETWLDHPAGPAVMLSSLTASRLDLRLAGDGSRWLQAWEPDVTTIDRDSREVVESDWRHDEDLPGFYDSLPDPHALAGDAALKFLDESEAHLARIAELLADPSGPRVAAFDREPTPEERWRLAGSGRPAVLLPRPRFLLGQDLAWPPTVPGIARAWTPGAGPCPGCGGRRLGVLTYCLVCCRSGLDDLIRSLLSRERRRAPKRERPAAARAGSDRPEVRRTVAAKDRPGLRGGLGS